MSWRASCFDHLGMEPLSDRLRWTPFQAGLAASRRPSTIAAAQRQRGGRCRQYPCFREVLLLCGFTRHGARCCARRKVIVCMRLIRTVLAFGGGGRRGTTLRDFSARPTAVEGTFSWRLQVLWPRWPAFARTGRAPPSSSCARAAQHLLLRPLPEAAKASLNDS